MYVLINHYKYYKGGCGNDDHNECRFYFRFILNFIPAACGYIFVDFLSVVYKAAGDSSAAIFTLSIGKLLHFVAQENLRHFLLSNSLLLL